MGGKILNKKFNRKTRIAIIEIDTPGSNANVLTAEFFEELKELVDRAEQDNAIKGIIFTTKKKKIFLAGADLVELQDNLDNEDILHAVITEGQELFTRLKNLHVPTVAAIHGVCLGGGLEFALACDARVASDDISTKIGLPEVMLGLLPAWGGCTRLLRLIGVVKSLKFILSGTPKPSIVCKKLGIIDSITCKEQLIDEAIKQCKKHSRKTVKLTSIFNPIIFQKARDAIMTKTKGNYPAPMKIIDLLARSTRLTEKKSLIAEKGAFLELAQTTVCRNLIRIFFLQEKSKKLKWRGITRENNDEYFNDDVTHTAVIGAGTMGAGIAHWISSRNISVLLKDISSEVLCRGLNKIGSLYMSGVLNRKFDQSTAAAGLARVSSTIKNVPLTGKDIVIEAVSEDINIKVKVLQDIENCTGPGTLIATNTSALSITSLAKNLKRPENLIGIHFFNPVHKMKLVEVIVGEQTSDRAIARVVEFVHSIGKLPIIVKDSPGFLVNRILLPYLIKAMWLATLGCDIEEIDKKMVKFGMPMGPFRLLDEIGLDIGIHVAKDLADRLPHMSTLGILDEILRLGHHGKKTGKGFYIYKKGKKCGQNKELINMMTLHKNSPTEDVVKTLVQVMTDEAELCLSEGIVTDPDIIDFGMIMGTGWAPFRGGPMTHSKL